ncbi:hypothetical protein [Nitrosopumilus sp.]|uniref:hypothetical protein n=1 Tax=Nitrosopumilus sp. TaxID=2024843 RepID=UPI00345BA925
MFSSIVKNAAEIFDFVLVLSAGPEAQKAYKKLGWTIFPNLNRYVAILNKKRFDTFVGKNSFEQSDFQNQINLERIKVLPSNFDTFWEETKIRFPITTNRTKNYLNWRYIHHPLIDYHFLVLKKNDKMVGYAVIRFETNNESIKAARIVDLIVNKEKELEIFQQILNYCQNKVDFVDFFCSGNFFEEVLKYLKFYNVLDSVPVVFNPLDPNRKHDLNLQFTSKLKNSELNKCENWYIVKGDSDQDRAN